MQGAKRDSYGSHYSSDSMCTVGSSSGGTARDETTVHPPHQLHSSASDPTVPGEGFSQKISLLEVIDEMPGCMKHFFPRLKLFNFLVSFNFVVKWSRKLDGGSGSRNALNIDNFLLDRERCFVLVVFEYIALFAYTSNSAC